ncbi:MAG: TonB C-terminal domain-containing protein [Candidatus Dependentiae bacterium]|nr:TonB C-terminal domain-containing protein [Candidatus Dependentiae bacterium]
MKERNEEHKKETTHPILIWIIASILFHMLLTLISIVLHIDDYRDTTTRKKDDRFVMSQQEKNSATMMLDQIKKPTTQSTKVEKSSPLPEKPIEKEVKPEDPTLIHTLIPGRKGLDLQNITDQLSNAEGQKPEKITESKPVEEKKPIPAPEPKKTQAPKLEEIIEKKEQPKKLSKNGSNLYEGPQEDPVKKQDASAEQEQVQKSTEQTSLDSTVVPSQTSPIDHYQFVPKQTMSLKDLQLGFNKYLNNVGNTECLIQQGNTQAVPDGQSLKNITYKNQFAKTMIGSIHAHPKARIMQYKRDKQISFVITIDRKGKLLDLQVTKESGDPMIDSIIIESLNTAGLYPAVPNFIVDDPYVQQWTILY